MQGERGGENPPRFLGDVAVVFVRGCTESREAVDGVGIDYAAIDGWASPGFELASKLHVAFENPGLPGPILPAADRLAQFSPTSGRESDA